MQMDAPLPDEPARPITVSDASAEAEGALFLAAMKQTQTDRKG